MENLFIARQPIYDSKQTVIGYELLYRNGDVDSAIFEDGDQASCEAILNSFMHIGIDTLAGSALVFINLPREFVINESLTPMFKEQCVLEILEDIEPTPGVIEGLKRLKQEGYRIALDDFVFDDRFLPFLELADFVKLDVLDNDEQQLRQALERLAPYPVKIIAEKVETQELHGLCERLGFEYYQGFFYCKPQLVKQKHVPANRLVVLNLLDRLQNPDLDYEEFERILAQDVSLSYKLLRYINSAMFSLRREVDSIKDAVVLLGLDNVRQWLTLILMSKVMGSKPDQLMVTALVRAKMCETLAARIKPEIRPQMFIIGLFSVLDALMDMPMVDLLDSIILNTAAKLALLDRLGDHGTILQMVLDYERCNWATLLDQGVSTEQLLQCYLESVEWADRNIRALRQMD